MAALGGNLNDSTELPVTNFFEGTEKLLEIWFTRCDGKISEESLKDIPMSEWEKMLAKVKCSIVNSSHHEMVDSYVLSESSMFVLKHRLILKTCGRTTLLDAIKPLRELADKHCGFNKVQDIFYSHKNLMRPHMQEEPHKCFAKEVEILDELFDNGEAYCLGKVNSDCWYLYTLNQFCDPILVPDQTLEVLMTKLDPEVMKMFTCEESSTAREITEKTGIGMLWPNMKIDDFLFDPCGYSMNGVFDEDKYMTIHVTPEDEFSYVSFETNASERCYKRMIGDVLQIFHPGKFILTVFANKHSVADISCTTHTEYKFSNYRKDAAQHVHFENYDLRYLSFQKAPS